MFGNHLEFAPRGHRLHLLLILLALALATGTGCKKDDEPANNGGTDADGPDAGGDTDPGCTTGEENCVCATGGECLPTNAAGETLVCSSDNVCVTEDVTPECTPGDTTCPCTEAGECNDPSDECGAETTCVPRTNCDGELGCACNAGACDSGLACVAEVCTMPSGLGVTLSGGDARGCDLLIETTGRNLADVVFVAGTRGRMQTRNERTAVSVIRTEDSALTGVVATLVFEDGEEATADDISSISATCYDRTGSLVTDVSPTAQ